MAEIDPQLIYEAEQNVTAIFNDKVNKSVRFHTIDHTREVVAACERIAEYYQLPAQERLILLLAAWFHDTGYSSGNARDHEIISAQHASEFLSARNASPELTGRVLGCITATRMPQSPSNTLENIICDADLYHLGTDRFKEKSRLLREELTLFGGEEISKQQWWEKNIEFLEAHKYFTSYGNDILQPVKEIHLKLLKEKLGKNHKETKKKADRPVETVLDETLKVTGEGKKKKGKDNQTERGISTVFRIMAQNQANLSQMADSKANILISVNSIILTIVISTLVTRLSDTPNLKIPVILLVTVCVAAIVFSILATRPTITGGTFTQEDIRDKKTNLLFFGNFYKMSLPDYDWAMMEMLKDKNYLYSSIVKDNYFLGVVLAKKYRFLRIAYNIFMYGIILTMIAFAVTAAMPQAGDMYLPGTGA